MHRDDSVKRFAVDRPPLLDKRAVAAAFRGCEQCQ
jgi:hypothetical protein